MSYSKTAVRLQCRRTSSQYGINVMTQYFLMSLWSFGHISYTRAV